MKSPKTFKGFTLIELLISIVILAIVMSSFPFIFQSMTASNRVALAQEAFFQEFSMLSLINSRYFDENNTIKDNFYKDLNASGGDDELYNNYSSKYTSLYSRIGKTQIDNNIYRSGCNDTVSKIGLDSGEISGDTSTYDDIDDFNGYTEEISGNNVKLHVDVYYINDNATYSDNNITDFNLNYTKVNALTNIKLITVWAEVGDVNVTLRYPTSNIGASKFLSLEEISR
ncbi:MAG: type II secretion system protein [Nautiliaceae bacterium]|jgi:prepilin-type N-terminal cleavage/methylation domain-containing protein